MLDLLYCEVLKLKRSKMFMLSCIGVTATPLMVFIGMIREKIKHPNVSTTYSAMFSEINMYALMLFGLLVYTVIAAYIFSREYTKNSSYCPSIKNFICYCKISNAHHMDISVDSRNLGINVVICCNRRCR